MESISMRTAKKTESRSFETKLSPAKVISAAVRFFSSRNYKVQSQSLGWVTFEPENKNEKRNAAWAFAVTAVVAVSAGVFAIVRGYDILDSVRRYAVGFYFIGSTSSWNSRGSLLIGGGILLIVLSIACLIGAAWMEKLSKLPQNVTITTEATSENTRVMIEHPFQKKVEMLIESFAPLLGNVASADASSSESFESFGSFQTIPKDTRPT